MTTSIYNTKYVIYMHTNTITGKSYIGKTTQGMKRRWQTHLSESKRCEYHNKFHNSVRKYGTDCWDHEVLYVSFEKDDQHLYEIEERLILDWDTFYNGYNSCGGGRGVGSGKYSPNYGKNFSNETIKRMSVAQLGKPRSKLTRKKLSIINCGIGNPQFKGYFLYNEIKQPSALSLSIILKIEPKTINKWCKNNTKIISNGSYVLSKFLQSLGTKEEIVGLTFKELEFDFEPI